MGKQKNKRHRLHVPAKTNNNQVPSQAETAFTVPPIYQPPENLFAGINIDVNKLNNKLQNDTLSLKSYKSTRSEMGNKAMTKKDKLSLRRKLLAERISLLERSSKKSKPRKRKTALAVDMNPLRDALPSLQSLLARKTVKAAPAPRKLRGIETSAKRKKNLIEDIGIYQKLLKNENLKKDPLNVVSEYVKAMVESQGSKF